MPVDAEERLAPQRLDVLDLALERPHHPVLPQPRELGPHADRSRPAGSSPSRSAGAKLIPGEPMKPATNVLAGCS